MHQFWCCLQNRSNIFKVIPAGNVGLSKSFWSDKVNSGSLIHAHHSKENIQELFIKPSNDCETFDVFDPIDVLGISQDRELRIDQDPPGQIIRF